MSHHSMGVVGGYRQDAGSDGRVQQAHMDGGGVPGTAGLYGVEAVEDLQQALEGFGKPMFEGLGAESADVDQHLSHS